MWRVDSEVEINLEEQLDDNVSDAELIDYIKTRRPEVVRSLEECSGSIDEDYTYEDYDHLKQMYFRNRFDLKKFVDMIGLKNINSNVWR